MSYQDNLPWAQLQQLQNAAQYSQQIPGFVNTQNPSQIHPNLIAQTTSQQSIIRINLLIAANSSHIPTKKALLCNIIATL